MKNIEKRAIEEKIKEKFTGTNNAGQFMLVFNDNKENGVTVSRLSEDSQDRRFETLLKTTRELSLRKFLIWSTSVR